MIRIKIGESEHDLDAADAQWINEQVRRYQREHGTLPCVRATIAEDGANMTIVSATCERGLTGSWNPKPAEAEVSDWWKRFRLDTQDWTAGNLNAFVQKLRQLF